MCIYALHNPIHPCISFIHTYCSDAFIYSYITCTYILNIKFKHSCFFNFRLFPPHLLIYLLLLCSTSSPLLIAAVTSSHLVAFFLVLTPLVSFCCLYSCFAASFLILPFPPPPPPPLALLCRFCSPLFSVGAATTTLQIFYRYT